ncbi:MAG: restriction endonuclease subunit S [Proteobacteria bacterium]|nr:restriction endonuclease subunit S [Pseudomonadota bacterium]
MNALFDSFDVFAVAPNGVKKLRELILQLAVQGKLVPQDPSDEPASVLLKKIAEEKKRLVAEGKIKKEKTLPPIEPEEVPFEVPEGWEWVRLDEVSSYIQRGKGPTYSDIEKIPVVSQKCIQWSGFDLRRARFIEPESIEAYGEERFLCEGDLLWNSTGTGTIGRMSIYKPDSRYPLAVTDSHVTVVRVVVVLPRFVLSWVASPFIQLYIEGDAPGTTNQVELATSRVKSQVVPLPSLGEQHRIVARVDQLMSLCDELEAKYNAQQDQRQKLNAAALDTLLAAEDEAGFAAAWQRVCDSFDLLYDAPESVTKLRQAILQLAVMGKLVKQYPSDEPASVLLKKIAAEKARLVADGKIKKEKPLPPIEPNEVPFEVPRGWEWCKMDSLVFSLKNDLRTGPFGSSLHKADHRKNGVPVWGIETISKRGSFTGKNKIFVDSSKAIELSSFSVKAGDIIVSRSGTVGELCRLPDDIPDGLLSTNLMKVSLNRALISPDFFCLLFKGTKSIDAQLAKLCFGSTRLFLTQSILGKLLFPLPPFAEQQRIVARVDQLMSVCYELEAKLTAARERAERLLVLLRPERDRAGVLGLPEVSV